MPWLETTLKTTFNDRADRNDNSNKFEDRNFDFISLTIGMTHCDKFENRQCILLVFICREMPLDMRLASSNTL
jgi:hypothetical protein